jgi:hypothetical protein
VHRAERLDDARRDAEDAGEPLLQRQAGRVHGDRGRAEAGRVRADREAADEARTGGHWSGR